MRSSATTSIRLVNSSSNPGTDGEPTASVQSPECTRGDETPFWNAYAARYPDELAKDGAGGCYYQARPRVLAVLKDPNNSAGFDLRDLLNSGAKWAIWHRLAEWMAGIHNRFPAYESVYGHTELKNNALRQSAVINVKKRNGGSSVDDATLHRFAFQDRTLLREQIQMLDPTLILACGTFEQLLWLLGDLVPAGVNLELPHTVVTLANGANLVKWRHPARCAGRGPYETLGEVLLGVDLSDPDHGAASPAPWFT